MPEARTARGSVCNETRTWYNVVNTDRHTRESYSEDEEEACIAASMKEQRL